MSKSKPGSTYTVRVARSYRAALDRLVHGKGRHPDHEGRIVRITPASVAREAGRSRNPLYTTHRDILNEIEAAAKAPGPAKDLAARVSELEEQLAKLREQVARHAEEKRKIATENLALLYRARTAEDQLASMRRQAAAASAGTNVRPLR